MYIYVYIKSYKSTCGLYIFVCKWSYLKNCNKEKGKVVSSREISQHEISTYANGHALYLNIEKGDLLVAISMTS
jgi:hypothetical protein